MVGGAGGRYPRPCPAAPEPAGRVRDIRWCLIITGVITSKWIYNQVWPITGVKETHHSSYTLLNNIMGFLPWRALGKVNSSSECCNAGNILPEILWIILNFGTFSVTHNIFYILFSSLSWLLFNAMRKRLLHYLDTFYQHVGTIVSYGLDILKVHTTNYMCTTITIIEYCSASTMLDKG